MNFIKRQLAIVVMSTMGFIALSGYFINSEVLRNFTDKDATNFYMIIAGFAAFLGCLNLLQLHLKKIAYKKQGWQFSVFTLIGFFIMIIFGFIYKGDFNDAGDPYEDLNNNGKWDIIEEFEDLNSNGKWDMREPYLDLNSNGKWDSAEKFKDLNHNGEYNMEEPYEDFNKNGLYDNEEPYVDYNKNNLYDDMDEPYKDLNNNGKWDDTLEPFTDELGNYEYDIGEEFIDANNNGIWNFPEIFTDKKDGVYTGPIKWGDHLTFKKSSFYWMYNYIYLPLGATMFALLAFFVASASYRAFRIRNFEATLLLISGVLLMLGRVPLGALIPWWVVSLMLVSILFAVIAPIIKNRKIFFISYLFSNFIFIILGLVFNWSKLTPAFLSIPLIQEWIMAVPTAAGSRAIMIGIALGIVAQSYRIMTGRERSILGD